MKNRFGLIKSALLLFIGLNGYVKELQAIDNSIAKEPTLLQQAAINAKAYKPYSGPYVVGKADTLFWDEGRNRLLPLRIYYPTSGSPGERFPIVIFSHGFGASKDFYAYLGEYYASHGYISMHPDHIKSDTVAAAGYAQAIQRGETTAEEIENQIFEYEGEARVYDVKFLLNHLQWVEAQVPGVRGKMKSDSIAMAGHSFGAGTTDLLAGTECITPMGRHLNFSEPRLKAFVSISGARLRPQIPNKGFENVVTFERITAPVVRIIGFQEGNSEEENTEILKNHLAAFNYYPATANKYEFQVKDADHQDFAGVSTKPGGKFYATTTSKNASLALFDSVLKNKPEATQFLRMKLPAFVGTMGSLVYGK